MLYLVEELPFRALSRADGHQKEVQRLRKKNEEVKAELWKAMIAEEERAGELQIAQELIAEQVAEVDVLALQTSLFQPCQ